MEPRVSVSQITTFRSSFADDIRTYAAAGLDGIGVWELKLGEDRDAEALELLAASGLAPAAAVPSVPVDPAAAAPRRPGRPGGARRGVSARASSGWRRSGRPGSSA